MILFRTFLILIICLQQLASGAPDDLSCLQIVCNFEQENLCGYENFEPDNPVVNGRPTQQWRLTQGVQKNLATGVRKPAEGKFYASTYLMKNDSAILVSQGHLLTNSIRFVFPLIEDRVIRFRFYKVTDNMLLKGCCDNITNCPFETERTAKITDFGLWKTGSFICKAGTEKVVFYGVNEGRNEGGIGIDDIRLFYPSSNEPNDAHDVACESNLLDNNLLSDLLQNMTDNGSDFDPSVNHNFSSILSSGKRSKNNRFLNDTDRQMSQSTTTPVASSTSDDFLVVLIPSDDSKLSKSNSTNSQNLPLKLSETEFNANAKMSSDFNKTVLRDSYVLSSRLYLAPNDTTSRRDNSDNKNTFAKTLDVTGLDPVPIGSSGQQPEDYSPELS